jgi:hypothetical protein
LGGSHARTSCLTRAVSRGGGRRLRRFRSRHCFGQFAETAPAAGIGASGFGYERGLDWSNPVNLVGEGMSLPEMTHPSAAVSEVKGANFEGGAGEVLRKGSGADATEVHIGVAKFKSAADAQRVRDWMHNQDLQQPCFVQCIFSPRPMAVPGVATARLVEQTPTAVTPPPKGQPTHYMAEFTTGPYLEWMFVQADAKAKAQVAAGVKQYYNHAREAAAG